MICRNITISIILILFCSSSFGQSAQPDSNLWVTNGQVSAIARDGNKLYLGGTFTHVGPNIPFGTALDIVTGAPDQKFAKPNGNVIASVPDGQGGWYICGFFSTVAGQSRTGLARINNDGSLHPWRSSLYGNIEALAISGNRLYVAGYRPLGVGTRTNFFIAALDTVSGTTIHWNQSANGRVISLAVNNNIIYAGGQFDSIGGLARSRIAALEITTGVPTSWKTEITGTYGRVNTIATNGNIVYVGGIFSSAGGLSRNNIAAIDASTGNVTSWNPNANKTVRTLAVNGGIIYAGGYFSTIGGQSRNCIAALDPTTGAATSWDPNPLRVNTGRLPPTSTYAGQTCVNAITFSGGMVYVCGFFTSIGGQTRYNLASLDVTTGKASSWNPPVQVFFGPVLIFEEDVVTTLSPFGNKVYIGGEFSTIGGQFRNHLAALDATTGQATSWNPDVRLSPMSGDPYVNKIKINKGIIYVAGYFDSVGNVVRRSMAAIDALTGTPTNWNPDVNGQVFDLALAGDKFYVCGSFDSVGGQSRKYLAALNVSDGKVTSWNPQADEFVWSLAVDGNIVYTGGEFFSIGGQSRAGLAAIDAGTGLATAWNPNPNFGPGNPPGSIIYKINVSGGTIYAGGLFRYIGSQNRKYIAAIDANTGNPTAWNPGANQTVLDILVNGNTVFVCGSFDSVGGQSRSRLAAIDRTTGVVASWNPRIQNILSLGAPNVGTLAIGGDKLYAGGRFRAIAGVPRFGIAAYSGVPTIVGTLSESNPMKVYPNPSSDRIRIDYLLPDPDTKLSLEVLDGFGRRMLQQENLSISTNLDISFLEKGLYIIVVKDAGGKIVGTERILKL